jgi:hypothetical protein
MRRTVTFAARQRMKIARQKFNAAEPYKHKKNIVHCLRYLLFAQQIVEYGKVRNFTYFFY